MDCLAKAKCFSTSLDDALVADELLRVHMSASPSPSMMMSSMHSGSHHMRLNVVDALVDADVIRVHMSASPSASPSASMMTY
jgi:hypothetical protein